ncbi:AbiU2 domain-containing protein [Clostridium butyricum]|uniref:AbiU2 domain-containing protein n=1 Tax=Clostridium butyricum TaxID=1492 RepID=UPI0035680C77
MTINYDMQLNSYMNEAMKILNNFQEDFKDEKTLNNYFLLLSRIFNLLDNANIKFEKEVFQKIQHEYRDVRDKNDSEEINIKWRRKSFTRFLLRNSLIWKDKLDKDNDVWSSMDKYIAEGTLNEYSKNIPMYYKNFMSNESQSKFEEMVDLIRNELISYHTKLVYCKRIIDFLNEEFAKDGVILTQTNFLNQYLNTAASEMILVSTKLFATANTKKNLNFGFDYLKDYIAKNCNNNSQVRLFLGGELRNMIGEGRKKCTELVKIRNSLIAHYDIEKVKETKNIKVSYEELNELYELSVKILQKLSFYRFDRSSCIPTELIKIQGFKSAVCQNPWSNGSNLDIDDYFAVLRKYFLPELMKATEEIKNKQK